MDELVQRLAEGKHPVRVGGPKPSLEDFWHRINDIGYVFIKFTDTRGGTDLGVRIEKKATDLGQVSLDQRSGIIHIEGTLTLNYIKVLCVAQIDLATLDGNGYLVITEEVSPLLQNTL